MNAFILTIVLSMVVGKAMAKNNVSEQRIDFLEQELNILKEKIDIQNEQIDAFTLLGEVKNNRVKLFDDNNTFNVYGIIRVTGAFDFKNSSARGRTNNQINRVPFDTHTNSASDFTAATSRLGLDIKKITKNENLNAKLEVDFWSDQGKGDGKLRIRQAYLDLNQSWLLGQTWSLMSNMETMTESIDYTQFLGASTTRVPQVRYDWILDHSNKLQVALEYAGERTSILPALTAKYTYKNNNLHVIGQGFVNEKQADLDSTEIKEMSWGVGGGFRYKFSANQSIQANYYHVKGDQKFVQYTSQGSSSDGKTWGGDFSIHPQRSVLLMNEFNSASIGYSYNFNQKLRSNIAVGIMLFDDESAYAKNNQDSNKKLVDHTLNLIYTPVNNADLGLEYHYGEREIFKGNSANISRINVSASYKF